MPNEPFPVVVMAVAVATLHELIDRPKVHTDTAPPPARAARSADRRCHIDAGRDRKAAICRRRRQC